MSLHEKYFKELRDKMGNLSGVQVDIPDNFNFAYDVVDVLAENPEKPAMMWCDDNGAERLVTFAQIKEESDKIASFLASLGLKKGDMVMLILKRHFEFWNAIIALHKLGVVAIPATSQLLTKDISYRVNAASIKGIICTPEDSVPEHVEAALGDCEQKPFTVLVRERREGWMSLEDETQKAAPFVRPTGELATHKDDMMLLYFTSGTSGLPKMVVHNYCYPIGHIPTAKYWHKVDPEGLHLTVAETGWGKAVWGKLYGQWLMEAPIFVYDMARFNVSELLTRLEKYRVTTFCAPPTIYRFLIQEDLSKYNLSSITHATIAGESLNPEVYEQLKKMTGLKIYEGFGQTETTLTVFTPYWVEPRPGSMGMASYFYDMMIADENGNEVPNGVEGELVMRVPGGNPPVGLFMEYYRDSERTNDVLRDGLYHTGDVAWRDEDGFFWYVGRNDDLIKSSGYRIGPFEVESILMEHPAVMECAVTGAPDPVRGQVVKATIVLAKGFDRSEELKLDIQNYVKTHTAPYKYPRILEFVNDLPKTISGKIRRVEIREETSK